MITMRNQGRCIVDSDLEGGFWLMLPDGQVYWKRDRKSVEAECRKWFKEHNAADAIGIGQIVWR